MDNKNKELVLVSNIDCVKCRFLRKPLEKRCKENWYKFKEMEYWPWMEEVTSVPCAMIGNDVILDYEGIVELVNSTSVKKSFY